MKHWLGIDLGTSSVKVLVVRDVGEVLFRGKAAYTEIAGSVVGGGTDFISSIRSALSGYSGPSVDGLAVVGQTPSLVTVDETGTPLFPLMGWRDTSPQILTDELRTELGESELITGIANLWDGSHLPAKVLRLGRSNDDRLGRLRWLLQPKDFVVMHLTGAATTDAWSSKGLWSVSQERPLHEVFSLAGIDSRCLPPVLQPWELSGNVVPEAVIPGLIEEGTPVAVGWTDALAGILAIGAATSPRAFILSGTSDIVGTSSRPDDDRPTDGVYCVPPTVSPLKIWYGPTQSSGASLQWLASLTSRSVDDLVAMAAGANATRAGFTPYLQGERAPIWDDAVRASFWNLQTTDGLPEFALAVLRGVAFSGRHVLDAAGAGSIDEIHLGGENVQEAGWIRARQEVMGCEMILHQEPQLTALGACMLARVASGAGNLQDSVDRLEGGAERVEVTAKLALSPDHYTNFLQASTLGGANRKSSSPQDSVNALAQELIGEK